MFGVIKMTRNKKIVVFLCIAVGILACLLIKHEYDHTFQRSRWFDEPQQRVVMLDDMMKKHPIVGMSEEEIMQFLGDEKTGATYYFTEPDNLVYYLGNRGKAMHDVWLVIELEGDIAVSWDIVEY
jgi:sugar/nucleoside kinase (ribokinase family)